SRWKLKSGPSKKSPSARPAPTGERLQKILAAAGLGSRRQIEEWIAAGRVSVNGITATLGARASPGDAILVDGKLVKAATKAAVRVLLYHKPVGERSEEHTSELQSPDHLVCRLLLEKK